MNESLASCPLALLLSFVALDMGSALLLVLAYDCACVNVDADFAFAYTLSKAIRAPRLAMDAAAAGLLARLWPALAAVRVSLLVDALASLPSRLRALLLRSPGQAAPHAPSRAVAEARRLADAYGLAYMAAKNVIGPVSIAMFYVLIRRGVDIQAHLGALGAAVGVGGAEAAGRMAGLLALGSWTSTLLFPFVVLGAAAAAPRAQALADRVVGRRKAGTCKLC